MGQLLFTDVAKQLQMEGLWESFLWGYFVENSVQNEW